MDPALEARLAEYRRLHDWRSTTFVTGPSPNEPTTRPTVKIAVRAKLRLPAQVRAYVWTDERCATKSAFGMPFEANGTPCEGVIGRSALLDDRERDVVAALALAADAELVEIAAKKRSPRPVVMCDFNPHHAFVFFDAQGVPFARFEPCFECGQFSWEPSSRPELLGTWNPPMMTKEERGTLATLLDRHGLGAWAFDSDGADAQRVRAYDAATYGRDPLTPRGAARKAERLALPPPVDRDVSPKRATPKDRRRLCTWFQDQLETNGLQMRSAGYECKSGVVYGFNLDEGDCERSVARCDTPTRQIEECLRAFARGPAAICDHGFPAACTGLRECVPGLTGFSPEPRPIAK